MWMPPIDLDLLGFSMPHRRVKPNGPCPYCRQRLVARVVSDVEADLLDPAQRIVLLKCLFGHEFASLGEAPDEPKRD